MLANSTGIALAECRRTGVETLAATKSGYQNVSKAIDDWHSDFVGVNGNARRLQGETRKLVHDLEGCDKRIQQVVAEGIRSGILKGNRIVKAALVALILNTRVMVAKVILRLLAVNLLKSGLNLVLVNPKKASPSLIKVLVSFKLPNLHAKPIGFAHIARAEGHLPNIRQCGLM
jgi:hypothetical protein